MRIVSNELTEPNDVCNDTTQMPKLFVMAVTHIAYLVIFTSSEGTKLFDISFRNPFDV